MDKQSGRFYGLPSWFSIWIALDWDCGRVLDGDDVLVFGV